MISYDYRKEKNYQPLYKLLIAWQAKRLLESLWLVELNTDTGSVRDYLMQVMDRDDGAAVIELKKGSDWSTVRAQKAGTDWLGAKVKAYPAF